MDDAEVFDHLKTKLSVDSTAKPEVMGLLDTLGDIPLAITQAGAYIKQLESWGMTNEANQAALLNHDTKDLRRDLTVPIQLSLLGRYHSVRWFIITDGYLSSTRNNEFSNSKRYITSFSDNYASRRVLLWYAPSGSGSNAKMAWSWSFHPEVENNGCGKNIRKVKFEYWEYWRALLLHADELMKFTGITSEKQFLERTAS